MNSKHSCLKKCISVLLVVSMLASLLSGCSKGTVNDESISVPTTTVVPMDVDTEQIIESTVVDILENVIGYDEAAPISAVSTAWEDYQGDIETFVCGLLINELKYKYDAFPGYVVLLDGTPVYGIGYTDYESCYVDEIGSKYCFEAGFIPFAGETIIPKEDFDFGLELYNLDYIDPNASFVLAYGSDAFTEHCVVYNQYVQYGVDSCGQLYYEACEYTRGECDESLGSLYSYDQARYVFDNDVGKYVNVTGTSLCSQIDFVELENEINRILDTQDANLVSVDVNSCAYIAQEAVTSYLLSMQEETFLGYSVQELIAASRGLDPLECFRLTQDGPMAIELDYDGGASALTKWLVGIGCVIVTAVAMVGSFVFIKCPLPSALSSAMAGTAIEIFMQVVISGETLDNVNWGKVAIAAATGAVSGFLGPYVNVTTAGAGYFFIDSGLGGLVGGIEHAVMAWMDGEEGVEIIKSFGYGFALGFALSAGFKAVGKVVEKLASAVGPSIGKLAERVFPKLAGKISAFTTAVSSTIYAWQKAADSTIFHSEYISRKLAQRQLARLVEDGSDELLDKALCHLSNSDIVDENRELISKEALNHLIADAEDGSVVAYFKKGDELVQIVKKNGMVGIVFDTSKYQTVVLPKCLIDNRDINFEEAAKLFKARWLEDPSLIPESIADAIKRSGVELEDMMPEDLVSIIKKSDWVMHENIDMETITLVSRSIHEEISHMGGFGLAKFVKTHMSVEFMDRFISSAATVAVQATP